MCTHEHQDCHAIGDVGKFSPCIPSTCAQTEILCLPIIHGMPSRQIYEAIDQHSLVLSIV